MAGGVHRTFRRRTWKPEWRESERRAGLGPRIRCPGRLQRLHGGGARPRRGGGEGGQRSGGRGGRRGWRGGETRPRGGGGKRDWQEGAGRHRGVVRPPPAGTPQEPPLAAGSAVIGVAWFLTGPRPRSRLTAGAAA